MNAKKHYPLITAALSLFIVVGISHGIGPILIVEPKAIFILFSDELNQLTNYEYSVYVSASILLIAQVIILLTSFLKIKRRELIELVSIFLLLVAYVILIYPVDDTMKKLGLITGIPFLFSALFTLTLLINKLKKNH